MTEINNRIEEVKKILEAWQDAGTDYVIADSFGGVAREISQLFPQPLDDKELREKNIKAEIVNAYHTWRKHCERLDHPKRIKEFTHRELYEQTASYFADQILALLQQKIEEARKQERERIMAIIHDWDKWVGEEGGEEKWQAKYECDTTQLVWVIEQALKGGE